MNLRIYRLETKCEFLKLLRTPVYVVTTLGFPLMFYIFFGLAMNRNTSLAGLSTVKYLLATYGTFGVIGVTLSGLGITLAMERGLGWLQLKKASPMPAAAYLFAKVVVCLAFSAVLVVLLFTLGAGFGGVRMPASEWLLLAGSLVIGSLPFSAMGLALGYFAQPNSAVALANMIHLPMAFCSGLWIPIQFLPHGLQSAAQALPAYHVSQIALAALNAPGTGSLSVHVEALAGFTLLFIGLALIGHRREAQN